MRRFGGKGAALAAFVLLGATMPARSAGAEERRPAVRARWTEVSSAAPWSARAGLQAVALGGRLLVMGGRVPNPPSFPPIPGDSRLLNDVWSSRDLGRSWTPLVIDGAPGQWPARAYFSAVTKGRFVYVIGGQDFSVEPNPCPPAVPGCPPFVSRSRFFNDVWRSDDGAHWERMTAAAAWEGRAGLSAAVLDGWIYVFGGSRNDDSSIIGGPPQRIYYNDVWRSRDGRSWTKVADAPWSKRAGAAVAVKDGAIYLLGGEVGFTCQPQPGCTLPYFNDVWRTRDGAHWDEVTSAAGWSPRPGHKCEAVYDRLVCFGGFGQPTNPVDVWVSGDGATWRQLAGPPWNAASPDEIKYDFDTAVATDRNGRPAIYTFGGDRETFDLSNPTNYLRVDHDVWRVGLALR